MAITPLRTYGPRLETSAATTIVYTFAAGEHIDVGETAFVVVSAAGSIAAVATSATDSNGNIYAVDQTQAPSSSVTSSILSVRPDVQLKTGDTMTVTLGASTTDRRLDIRVVTGVGAGTRIDQRDGSCSYTAGTTGTAINSGDNIVSIINAGVAGQEFDIGAGTYRITSKINPKNNMRLLGAGAGSVTITAAKLLTGWTGSGPYNWSGSTLAGPTLVTPAPPSYQNPQMKWAEQLYFDGVPLFCSGAKVSGTVYGSSTPATGQYYVDFDADTLKIFDNPSGHTLEFSGALNCIDSTASGVEVAGLTVFGSNGRGIRANGPNWNIHDNVATGCLINIGIPGQPTTVTRNTITYGGQYGLNGDGDGQTVTDNEIAHNGTLKLYDATGGTFAFGGFKFASTIGMLFARNLVHHNEGPGCWWDVNCANITIQDNESHDNHSNGIWFEISYNATITGNKSYSNGSAGIYISTSQGCTISGNEVWGNGTIASGEAWQIRVIDANRTDAVSAGHTFPHRGVDNAFTANEVWQTSSTVPSGGQRNAGGSSTWPTDMWTRNTWADNTWHTPVVTTNLWSWNNASRDQAGWIAQGNDPTPPATYTADQPGSATRPTPVLPVVGLSVQTPLPTTQATEYSLAALAWNGSATLTPDPDYTLVVTGHYDNGGQVKQMALYERTLTVKAVETFSATLNSLQPWALNLATYVPGVVVTTPAWGQVNPHGSGFQNTGALGPWAGHDTDLIGGGDTSGLHKSVNKGHDWMNRDGDLTPSSTHAASIEPHPSQQGRWFALMGNNTSGGLWESTDNGDTWTNVSSGTPNVFGDGALLGNSGANSLLGNGNGEHPRSVGRLITVDDANGYIYVATFSHGVYRAVMGATSGASSWTQIYSTANTYTRGILYDSVQDVLYFSTFSDPGSDYTTASGHIWRSANPRAGSPTWVALNGSPMCCSAMIVLADRLYACAHPITANAADRGVWYLDSAHNALANTVWTKITAAPTSGNQRWMSIDGYKSGSNTVLWAGCASNGATSVVRLASGGGAFTGVVYPTSAATVKNDMGGPNTPTDPWWMYTANPAFMIGKGAFVASVIRVNPQNHSEVYVWGRSGVWHTTDDGANWYPVVKGIGATVTLVVNCDPRVQGTVYVGLGDWSIVASQDDLANIDQYKPGFGSFTYSMCIDESTTPTTLIAAASSRQDASSFTSQVRWNANLFTGGAWQNTGLSVANQIIVALTVCYSGATRVFIAGDSGGTLWRKVGNAGAWTQVPDANMNPSGGIHLNVSDTQPFARDITRTAVYLYDRGTGIWRSTNQGLNWTRIWSHPAGNSSDQSGWVDVDPNSAHILYVSDSTSVYKITDADTCGVDAATHVTLASAIGAKGPMAVDKLNNKIGICDITATAKFWESSLSTINFSDKSDALYFNAAGSPQWLSYDRNGAAHVALSGNGMISQAAGTSSSPPFNTALPAVAGSVIEGSILTESDGTWSGTPTPTLTRKWQVSPDNVAWADVSPVQTGTSYTIPGGGTVVGDYYRVHVTATNTGGSATADSASVGPVVTSSNPVNTVLPVISGTVQIAQTLSTTDGTWTGGPTITYQWETSATGLPGTWSSVGGATASTYLIPAGVAGSFLRCKLTGTNINGATNAWATKVGPVIPLAVPNDPPVVSATGPADVVVLPATAFATATASDADGIAGVTVSLDQGPDVDMVSDGLDGWSLDLGAVSVGSHLVLYVATDLNASPLTAQATKVFSVIPGDDGGNGGGNGGGGGSGGEITISTDIGEVELRIHQRGLA